MIPQHRLANLLDHVKQTQINNCFYHNTANPPSLYSDHMCDRNDFPLQVSLDLHHHSDEVWYCEFSHDGTKLVTAGKDHNVLIYNTADFTVIHRLTEHDEGVAFASWSPDDSKLITCSQDHKARVWSVAVSVNSHHTNPNLEAHINWVCQLSRAVVVCSPSTITVNR
jgi:WD40 repeat protein